jgi:hypothetical protein
MVQADIKAKLAQATFHLKAMGTSKDDALALESHFAAYLAVLKSAVYYIQTWMIQTGKISRKGDFWPRLSRWEGSHLSADQQAKWLCILLVRNEDIHAQPIAPATEQRGYFPQGYFPNNYFPKGYWPDFKTLTVTHPTTNAVYELFDLCQTGIDIVTQLVSEYTRL